MDRRFLLGGLLIASGVGLVISEAASAARRPRLRPGDRVLLIGDSLAAGLHPHMKQLAREEGVEYQGSGRDGTRIDEWARDPWLRQTMATFEPTVVLVSLGTNDVALGPERQADDLDELLTTLTAEGATVVWIGPPELPFEADAMLSLLRREAPYYFESEDYDIPRAPDGLHPTAAGYAGWAGSIWRWLT